MITLRDDETGQTAELTTEEFEAVMLTIECFNYSTDPETEGLVEESIQKLWPLKEGIKS